MVVQGDRSSLFFTGIWGELAAYAEGFYGRIGALD
jgi:hypothetical protein